jgi:O-succinylbenzoic acid--CoA ligase
MDDWLAARANASPQALALLIGERQWTYAELHSLVTGMASCLSSYVQPGQRVALLLPNNLAFVCLIHALAKIGALIVPLNTRLTSHELAWQLDHVGCTWLIASTEMADQASLLAREGRGLLWAQKLLDNAQEGRMAIVNHFRLDNMQAIVFTSGTSGRPKGAVLSFANHFWSATASAFRLGVQRQDRWLCCLPLFHVGGLAIILRSCLYGTAVVLHNRFEPQAISHSLDTRAITLISLVPTMVIRLLDFRLDRPWPASLRHLLLGGAAAPPDLIRRGQELQIPLSTTYGLTEAASQVATMGPDQTRRKPGSVGKPLIFTSVQIIDDRGQEVPAGELGEIVVSGPTVMTEYYNEAPATSATIRDGRLHTGDIGYLDTEGDLWLVQRREDIIVSGGENVYPSEVENALVRHPSVAAASVVGIPDREWGHQVAAMVTRHGQDRLTERELLAFCREHLAGYKLPRFLLFVDRLPQTASGKVQRQKVAEQLQQLSRRAPGNQNDDGITLV